MHAVSLINERTGMVVGKTVWRAETFWTRLKGLLGRKNLFQGEGLWIQPCKQVHMIGMSIPLSIWFLNESGVIVGIIDHLIPGEISPKYHQAASVLEFNTGWANQTGTVVGDVLHLFP
ncbi:MAG: DUF192 domain-containing protein [Desulfitobacterium hafniense]|nr:DUF192 domain-containing protein [Desulfitobacterium hafniense]